MHALWIWVLSFFVWLSADADLIEREAIRAAAAGAATAAVFAPDVKPVPVPKPTGPTPAPSPPKAGLAVPGQPCLTGTCPRPAPARK